MPMYWLLKEPLWQKYQKKWNPPGKTNGTSTTEGAEWSKSEREKQILYFNADMWNLEKRYRWSYLQSRSRDIDKENKYMDTKGERGMGAIGTLGLTYIYIYMCVCIYIYICIFTIDAMYKTDK